MIFYQENNSEITDQTAKDSVNKNNLVGNVYLNFK